ncbi:hypothetical protein D3C73_980230 [compost metagenome]
MQVTRLGLDPGVVVIGRRQAQAALHRDVGTQRREFLDHLIDQRIQIDALKIQRRGPLLQSCIGQHLVHQTIEVFDVVVHAFAVFFQGLRGGGRADHLQAKAQTRHRRAQFVGHRTHQFTLDRQQLLQMLGHAVERRRQSPDRVRAARRNAGFQAAFGDARGRRFQTAQASFKLPHQ